MTELRCDANKKFADIDPLSLRFIAKCRECTKRAGHDVLHAWTFAEVFHALAEGDVVVYPSSDESISHDPHHARVVLTERK